MNTEHVSRLPPDVARTISTMKIESIKANLKRLNDATPGVNSTRTSMLSMYTIGGYQLQCVDNGTIELWYDAPGRSRRSSRSSSHPSHYIMTIVRWEWKYVGDKKIAVVKIGMLDEVDENAVDRFIAALNDKELIKILLSLIYKFAIYKNVPPEHITIDISIPNKKELNYSIKTMLGKYFSK